MEFLKPTDFNGVIDSGVYNTLGGDIDESEKLAISELDPLRSLYDISAELKKTDSNRSDLLVRISTNITAYYLYNTVPDDEIPQRIIDNYKKELGVIEKLAAGKYSSTLAKLTAADGSTKTTFRWGSNPKRTHELYPRQQTDEFSV